MKNSLGNELCQTQSSHFMLLTPHCCAQAAGSVQFPPAGSFSRAHSPFLMSDFCHGWSYAKLACGAPNESKTPWAAATQTDPEKQRAALYTHLFSLS